MGAREPWLSGPHGRAGRSWGHRGHPSRARSIAPGRAAVSENVQIADHNDDHKRGTRERSGDIDLFKRALPTTRCSNWAGKSIPAEKQRLGENGLQCLVGLEGRGRSG